MTYAYPIIHAVLDVYRGLPGKLAGMTDKSKEWWRSHGYEPKTVNPEANGSISEVDHYMRYARRYEAAERGAGRMLNNRVFQALEDEFAENDLLHVSQAELHTGINSEVCDVQNCLAKFDIDSATKGELVAFEHECDEAIEKILAAKGRSRVRRRELEMKQRNGSLRRVG